MNILIIGANGKLGSAVLSKLQAAKRYELGAFVRTPLKTNKLNVREFIGDIIQIQHLSFAIQWADCVINCSGKVGYSIWDKKELFKTNMHGIENIVLLCSKHKKPLIHAGSAASYGYSKTPHYFKENDDVESRVIKTHSAYFISKFKAEMCIKNSGISYIILRPGSIVHSQKSSLSRFISYSGKGYKLSAQGGVNFVHIDDVVSAFLAAINKIQINSNIQEIYNIGGTNISIAELTTMLNPSSKKIPYTILLFSGICDVLFGWYKSFISFETLQILQNHCYIDSSKAINELAYTPHSLSYCIEYVHTIQHVTNS